MLNFRFYSGSARYSSGRVGSRNRKEDGFAVTGEGKSSRRGGGGDPTSYEASQAKVFPPHLVIINFYNQF